VCYDLILFEVESDRTKTSKEKEALKLINIVIRQIVSVTPVTDVIIKHKKSP
jgi:hypothetical protein